MKKKLFVLAISLLMAAGLALWGLEAGAYREETLGPWDTQALAAIEIHGDSANVRIYDSDDSLLEINAEGWCMAFDARVSDKDLFETYLPAFRACVREGKVEAVMGAYNRTNGEPCCGHKYLLQEFLRDAHSEYPKTALDSVYFSFSAV